jgi:Zn-dependent protease with chaperone function
VLGWHLTWRKKDMEGLILMGVYVVIAAVAELVAVGIGFITDEINSGWSMIIFLINTGIALTLAWPLALWLTRARAT